MSVKGGAVIFSIPQRKDEVIDKVGKLYNETLTTNSSRLLIIRELLQVITDVQRDINDQF